MIEKFLAAVGAVTILILAAIGAALVVAIGWLVWEDQ